MFPAGKYYIGDLCYVIEDWDKVCNLTIDTNGVNNGEFPWRDKSFWMNTTKYGDGTYSDQDGNEYGVDAGLIGIIPAELMDKDDIEGLGHVIEFKEPFECSYDDGTFYIGHVEIQTGPGSMWESDDEENEDSSGWSIPSALDEEFEDLYDVDDGEDDEEDHV